MLKPLRRTLSAVMFGFIAVSAPALALVPPTTAVEGVLSTALGGAPVADGPYAITFSLYAAASGGSALWSEGPTEVQVGSGRFAASLGAKTPLDAPSLAAAPGLWLGVQVGTDPELPRQPWRSVVFALHAQTASSLACSGCIDAAQLAPDTLKPYAKAADLAAYAPVSALQNYAKSADLSGYAKTTDLADYVKAAALAKVAGTGSYADLQGLPVLAKVGAACGSGLVVHGIDQNGSLQCSSSKISASDLPADGLDEVSNGVLSTQFLQTSSSAAAPFPIPDFSGAGVSDAVVMPDVGLAEALTITVKLSSSDVSKIRIDLYDPVANKATIYDGESTGTTLNLAVTSETSAFLAGWVGKSAKGSWSLVVADLAKGPSNPDGKVESWAVTQRYNATKQVQVNGDLILTGKFSGTGAQWTVPSGAVMSFNLKACPFGWSELVAARGRTIVGLPAGGQLAGTVGTALSNMENRAVGKHTHPVTDPGHTHTIKMDSDSSPDGGSGAPSGEDNGVYTYTSSASTTGISIVASGTVDGTNAPYIQLLMCQKN